MWWVISIMALCQIGTWVGNAIRDGRINRIESRLFGPRERGNVD